MISVFQHLQDEQPQFFSAGEVAISAHQQAAMVDLITAIESVIALPAYQQRVLAQATAVAQQAVAARGVFFGYDFHLTPAGPRLIEINTNAGGALLNAYLRAGRLPASHPEQLLAQFVAMFREEWRLARGEQVLRRIAIVDEQPAGQFLAPEFLLFQDLFARHGIAAVVADPSELQRLGNRLYHAGQPIDLIYNRLTDFSLNDAVNADLKAVFMADGVVLTPHPRAHALYADKRNLLLLSDEAHLLALGVPAAVRQVLLAGIPSTVTVSAAQAEAFWAGRKQWFFKPAVGFGSRAAYRGDKLTKRVFEEIIQGGYIAQAIVPPSEQSVLYAGVAQSMKLDVRCYVYQGHLQLLAARLYQGQTTNFRTPGGGFAPVVEG